MSNGIYASCPVEKPRPWTDSLSLSPSFTAFSPEGIYLLPVDMGEAEVSELWALVGQLGGVPSTYLNANVIASGSWAPKRVERELAHLNLMHQADALPLTRSQGFTTPVKQRKGHPTPGGEEQETLAQRLSEHQSDRKRWLEEMRSKVIVHVDWVRACAERRELVDFESFRISMSSRAPSERNGNPEIVPSTPSSIRASPHVSASPPPTDSDATTSEAEQGPLQPEQWAGKREARSSDLVRELPKNKDGGPDLNMRPATQTPLRLQVNEADESVKKLALEIGVAIPAILPGMSISLDPPPKWQNSQYACERPTPLKSACNQGIVDALTVLHQQRGFTGDTRGSLAYLKALSIIKSYPGDLVTHPEEAKGLKGVGKKVAGQVSQFAELGRIPEADLILQDPAFVTLKAFNEVYRIGPAKARELWEKGFRTIDDLVTAGVWSPVGEGKNVIKVEDALSILPDLRIRISRHETEHIVSIIRALMEEILPGTESIIVGGYRRGKPTSSDIDVIFTSPPSGESAEEGQTAVLQWRHVEQLMHALREKSYLKHYITASGSAHDPSLQDMALCEVVTKMPPPPASSGDGEQASLHRRVDLMFCRREVFGAMVTGWTGSALFERDLRRRAKELNLKFHSDALVDRNTHRLYSTPTEADVFRLLQIPYMPPEWRNCDP